MSYKIIQSYIPDPRDESRGWFVSTANRRCSAVESYGLEYAETLVAPWEPGSREIGDFTDSGCTSTKGSADGHFKVCRSLLDTGELPTTTEAQDL